MTDTEKKIAEIRETVTCFMGAGNDTEYDRALNTLKENAGEWIPFLLLELERLEREYAEERAAHNAHVAELCELEQERNMYKSSSEVFYERLKKEAEQREKLVECLRFYERMARGREANDGGRRARTIFAEIGVTVSEMDQH